MRLESCAEAPGRSFFVLGEGGLLVLHILFLFLSVRICLLLGLVRS